MKNILQRVQQQGFSNTLRLVWRRAGKKLAHLAYLPAWYVFKLRNLGFTDTTEGVRGINENEKEQSIRKILSAMHGGTFLEIGIGEFPRFVRLELINKNSINYTGCDFESVCKSHQEELAIKGFDTSRINFVTNSTGTYSWTLFEMLQSGQQFDTIYVDGHHTFYIDLPAMLLADKLLKPGGYLLLDDTSWTLSFLRSRMMKSISQWYFYHTIYDLSEYTEAQQSLPHIGMIAEELLIKRSGYTKDADLSSRMWWALKKPKSIAAN